MTLLVSVPFDTWLSLSCLRASLPVLMTLLLLHLATDFTAYLTFFFLVNSCLPSSSRTGATALNIYFPPEVK